MKLDSHACGRRVVVGLALTTCLVAVSIIIPTPRVPGQPRDRTSLTHVSPSLDGSLAARRLNVARPSEEIQLCQAVEAAGPCETCGVDGGCVCRHRSREDMRAIAWQEYAQGEHLQHARIPHVHVYRLRVDDELDLIYHRARKETLTPDHRNAADKTHTDSSTQAGLHATVESCRGRDGPGQTVRITPEGTISLPVLGAVQAQGLTLRELRDELSEQYREHVSGIEVIPILARRAPRYIYVVGEVASPGRFELSGPTSVTKAIAMAGSGKPDAHLRQVVVFRRGDDWRLLGTVLDLRPAAQGKQAAAEEVWLSDSDLIVVPKSPILVADEFIERVFTQGVYGVFPLDASLSFARLSTL